MKKIFLVFLLGFFLGPLGAKSPERAFEKAKIFCKVQDPALNEISGMAVSPSHKKLIWVHNDSGDGPVVYGLDFEGKRVGKIEIAGGKAFDWEDMAAGKFRGKNCLFLGDIGDNFLVRPSIQIYIVPEPSIEELKSKAVLKIKALKVLHLTYPDGAHNAEALAVDRKGNLYIWEKVPNQYARMYGITKEEMEQKDHIKLKNLRTLDIKKIAGRRSSKGYLITGADISPSGKKLALRGYRWAAELDWPLKKSLSSVRVYIPKEPQGESIAYQGDSALLITSEKKHQPIYILKRR